MGNQWRSGKISKTNLKRKENQFGSTERKLGRNSLSMGEIKEKKKEARW